MRLRLPGHPRYLFLKHTAPLHNYFRELCEDVAADDAAVVFSDVETHRSGQILYVKGPKYDRTSMRTRAASWLKFFLRSLIVSWGVPGRPTLFIVTNPPMLSLVGYLQHRLRGRRYVLWIDDVWPDVLVRRGVRPNHSLLVRLHRAFNRLTFRHADHIITIGPYMRRTILPYARGPEHVSVVPTWTDADSIRPIPKNSNAFAQRFGQTGKTTVLYSGNMGLSHDMRSIVEAARLLVGRGDLHFLLIGSGAQFEWVSSASRDLPNVTVLPFQPAEVLPLSLATGDIAIACLEPGMEGISMPSKTYTSMAAGSAILGICAQESDLAALIRDCDCGVVVEPHHPQQIADSLVALIDAPLQLARLRQNARRAVETRFSRAVCVSQVRAILRRVEGVAENRPALEGTDASEHTVVVGSGSQMEQESRVGRG